MTKNKCGPSWVKAKVTFRVQNPAEDTRYLGETDIVGQNPLELSGFLYGLVRCAAEFWAASVGGGQDEINQQMDKFRERISRLTYAESRVGGGSNENQ
jgi:hypothetical protein